MPRYVYECFECGHTVEKLEGWNAPAQQPCTECDQTLQRIPSAPAIVFKGSGWYSTDSKKSNWKSRRDEDRDDSSEGESSDSESEPVSSNGTGSSEREPTAAATD